MNNQVKPATESEVESLSVFQRVINSPRTPYVIGLIVFVCLSFAVLQRWAPNALRIGKPSIVVFDPVRFINSQRAAASILSAQPNADLTLTLTQVAKQSEAVIREEARGSLVLVKQTVVLSDDLPDITDAVLQRFGLPTTVPTISTKSDKFVLEDIAPSDSAFGAAKLREDYTVELQEKSAKMMRENEKKSQQDAVVP